MPEASAAIRTYQGFRYTIVTIEGEAVRGAREDIRASSQGTLQEEDEGLESKSTQPDEGL
jgi:hypothetical protein